MKMPPRHERLRQYAHTRDGMTGEPLLEQTFRDDMEAAATAAADLAELARHADHLNSRIVALDGELQAALLKLYTIRQQTIQECWDAINAYIKPGRLQGNGCDDIAQRNGMILATNILHELREPK